VPSILQNRFDLCVLGIPFGRKSLDFLQRPKTMIICKLMGNTYLQESLNKKIHMPTMTDVEDMQHTDSTSDFRLKQSCK
jgi:hypothetical protein